MRPWPETVSVLVPARVSAPRLCVDAGAVSDKSRVEQDVTFTGLAEAKVTGVGTGFYEDSFFLGAEVGLGYPFTMASFGLPLSLIADMSADHKVSAGARVRLPAGFTAEADWVREKSFGGAVNFRRKF